MNPAFEARSRICRAVAGDTSATPDWSDPRLLGWSDTVAPAVWPVIPQAARAAHSRTLEGFRLAHQLNAQRNAELHAQLGRVVARLNAGGIRPILLKGAGHLATGLWPTPGSRLLGDLDLMVGAGEIDRAFDILQDMAGKGAQERGHPELTARHKHLAPVIGAGGMAPVELHHAVFPVEHEGLAPHADLLARSSEITVGEGVARLPSPTDRVLMAMMHGPAGGGTYLAPLLQLRDLLDVRFLAARHGNEIDWPWLEHHLTGQGWAVALEITNRCLVRFTGMAPPFPRGGPVQRLDAARWLWQVQHPRSIRAGRALRLARYTVRSLAAGGEPRHRALRYLAQAETYRRAYRRYVLGQAE